MAGKQPAISAVTEYAYKSLPKDRQVIRLLRLRPASSDTEELLADFILADVDQNPLPEYEALSYTWGDHVFPEILRIDDEGAHAITVNLWQCLVSLRRTDAARVLWVDAVCINQDDIQEKSQQVEQMGKIYKMAKRTLIWLGQPSSTPESLSLSLEEDDGPGGSINYPTFTYKNGKRFIVWPGQRFSMSAAGYSTSSASHSLELDPSAEMLTLTTEGGKAMAVNLGKRSYSPLPPNSVPLDGLALARRRASELLTVNGDKSQLQQAILHETKLFQRVSSIFSNDAFEEILRYQIDEVYANPWFTRMWIVQEVCLSSEAVLIHRGREMDWVDFAIALALIRTSLKGQGRMIPAKASFEKAYELILVTSIFKAATAPSRPMMQQIRSVSRLSHTLRGQQCKFDQDRIYALLSLQPEESPLSSILPDYTKPVLQVFRDFAGESLSMGMLETLYDAGIWDRRDAQSSELLVVSPDSLPTWVPDFRHESRNPRLPWLKDYFRQQLESTLVRESTDALIPAIVSSEGVRLTIEVLAIDKIKAIVAAPNFPPTDFLVAGQENSFDAVINHVKKCKTMYERHGSQSAYAATLHPETDRDAPFWAALVSYSEYSGTPFVITDLRLTAAGLQQMSRVFEKFCLDEGGVLSSGRESLNVDIARPELLRRMGPEGSNEELEAYMVLTFYDLIRETMDGIHFMVTQHGFVGLLPPTQILADDILVLINGAPIPFILRRAAVADTYVLVGSCYVSGFMDRNVRGEYRRVHLI